MSHQMARTAKPKTTQITLNRTVLARQIACVSRYTRYAEHPDQVRLSTEFLLFFDRFSTDEAPHYMYYMYYNTT